MSADALSDALARVLARHVFHVCDTGPYSVCDDRRRLTGHCWRQGQCAGCSRRMPCPDRQEIEAALGMEPTQPWPDPLANDDWLASPRRES